MIKKVDDPGKDGGGNSGWVAKAKEPKSIGAVVAIIAVVVFVAIWMNG